MSADISIKYNRIKLLDCTVAVVVVKQMLEFLKLSGPNGHLVYPALCLLLN